MSSSGIRSVLPSLGHASSSNTRVSAPQGEGPWLRRSCCSLIPSPARRTEASLCLVLASRPGLWSCTLAAYSASLLVIRFQRPSLSKFMIPAPGTRNPPRLTRSTARLLGCTFLYKTCASVDHAAQTQLGKALLGRFPTLGDFSVSFSFSKCTSQNKNIHK